MNDNDQSRCCFRIKKLFVVFSRECISSVCARSHVEFNTESLKTSLEEKVLKKSHLKEASSKCRV